MTTTNLDELYGIDSQWQLYYTFCGPRERGKAASGIVPNADLLNCRRLDTKFYTDYVD